MTHPATNGIRPRVAGEREREILNATLDVLANVGYDRLTMDAVASRGRVSKATLYRRWNGKAGLIIEALLSLLGTHPAPDSGTLRGDMLEASRNMWGLTDGRQLTIIASVLTAVARDTEFAALFREKVLDPRVAIGLEILDRAKQRGEIRTDVDLALFNSALPSVVLNRHLLLGRPASAEEVAEVIDQIVLPALLAQ